VLRAFVTRFITRRRAAALVKGPLSDLYDTRYPVTVNRRRRATQVAFGQEHRQDRTLDNPRPYLQMGNPYVEICFSFGGFDDEPRKQKSFAH
jgi:hypothetical protein